MAQVREFKVTLYPAHRERGFFVTKVNFGNPYPNRTISAAGMLDLVGQVEAFANQHGEGCSASVRCLGGRKPPGFKKATQDLYFNIKELETTD